MVVQRGLWSTAMNTGLCAQSRPPKTPLTSRNPPPLYTPQARGGGRHRCLYNSLAGGQTDLHKVKLEKRTNLLKLAWCLLQTWVIKKKKKKKRVWVLSTKVVMPYELTYEQPLLIFSERLSQRVAVITRPDRAIVSEDSQQALQQQGAIWKPCPQVTPSRQPCLPKDWRHGGDI